jgi:hypothetical protein
MIFHVKKNFKKSRNEEGTFLAILENKYRNPP